MTNTNSNTEKNKDADQDNHFSTGSRSNAWPGLIGVALVSLSLSLPVLAAPLEAGSKITAPYNCTYLPGYTLDGTQTGMFGIESSGQYAAVSTPNLPGGHWELHGEYPKTNYMSFEGLNGLLQVDGFKDGKDLQSDPGSVNPFQPGQPYVPGSTFTLRIDYTPPSERQYTQPADVMYIGYRQQGAPRLGVQMSRDKGFVLQTISGTKESFGGVPLPTLSWVVDNPSVNPIQNTQQLCDAMRRGGQPLQSVFAFFMRSIPRVPAMTEYLKQKYPPLFFDLLSGRDGEPYVNVLRPMPSGYTIPLVVARSNYTLTAPNPKYGKFYVIRVKQLTTSHVAEGIPNTGTEQVAFSVWCGDQAYSYVANVTECLREDELHPDSQGYVTLVVSPKNQRPVIDGKPYADWIEHPGAGAWVFRAEFSPNPETYPQSPHFLPADMGVAPNIAMFADMIQGRKRRPEMKQHMGEYYPQVYYCTKEKFEAGQCTPPEQ